MLRYILTTVILFFAGSTYAGDFTVFDTGEELIVDYTEGVEWNDYLKLADIMEDADGRPVYIFINSPGGSAYGGVYLFWEAAKHDNLTTIAGADFGAWSAAALFWSGGPERLVEVGGIVSFHHAYCNPWNPPGCDTTEIDRAIYECYEYAFGSEFADAMWHTLDTMRDNHGVSGWVGLMSVAQFGTDWYVFTTSGSFLAPWDGEC